ncbi:hypothetical protein [Novosphingopyxis baekryungensis]|uniref:hypothetical protein n=1 Tax=Novosphingopyxis baekryungensis TaxID=279369 RepID=UPI0003B69D38|nr:hypothetical protein [Novosphingopyxis baekryungensis]
MTQERIIMAIGRIERALARIERAALDNDRAGSADLARRHDALKNEARRAVSDMDDLLGTLAPNGNGTGGDN